MQKIDEQIKLNLGCGENHKAGYVNVDKFGTPDVLFDLETFPWPWENDSVGEIVLYHVLEHLGQLTDVYLGIIKELYRVCAPEAKIHITVPHPRHDSFINDPTHVRIVTIESLGLLSKKNNHRWVEGGFANSPLGLYLDVDFEVVDTLTILDPLWQKKLADKEVSEDHVREVISKYINVVAETQMTLQVIK